MVGRANVHPGTDIHTDTRHTYTQFGQNLKRHIKEKKYKFITLRLNVKIKS